MREITYEGQAAIWLERLATGAADVAPAAIAGLRFGPGLDGASMVRALVALRREGVAAAVLARTFHEALADGLAAAVRRAAAETAVRTVVCSGGVWQNRLLLDAFAARIGGELELLLPERTPVNDGGIAVGQVAIAGMRTAGGGDA